MKVILRLIFIPESMGWIIQLNIAFVAKAQFKRRISHVPNLIPILVD